jgi:hypothetical protein
MESDPKIIESKDNIKFTENSHENQENNTLFPKTEEEICLIKKQIMENKEDANYDFKNCNYVSAINKYTICKFI